MCRSKKAISTCHFKSDRTFPYSLFLKSTNYWYSLASVIFSTTMLPYHAFVNRLGLFLFC